MLYSNPFFKKKNKVKFNDILTLLKLKNIKSNNLTIYDIKNLEQAKRNDITFFNSRKYIDLINKTKSKFIITNSKYKSLISKKVNLVVVKNVFLSVAKVTEFFYPDSIDDTYDNKVSILKKINKYKNLKFGFNIQIGKNVNIGKNCSIGHNTIIESNVHIGNNCSIGNNVILKKTILGNYVNILDGAIIGKKGFGFSLIIKKILDILI